MIITTTIFYSLLLALLVTFLLTRTGKRRGPGPRAGFLFYFVICFFFIWAFGSWITPVGPMHWGVPWLSYSVLAAVFLILLLALIPAEPVDTSPQAKTMEPAEKAAVDAMAAVGVGCFFWIFLLFMALALVARFWHGPMMM